MKIEQLAFAQISLQTISDGNGANPFGRPGKKQITHTQGIESADIRYHFIDRKNHIGRMSSLDLFSIDSQREMQILQITGHLIDRNKIADYRRACKSRAVKSIPTVTAS